MIEIASKRYSRSLFEAAVEQDMLDTVFAEVGELKKLGSDNKAFFKVLEYPMVTLVEKYNIINEVFVKYFDSIICDFLKLLIEKERVYLLDEIAEDFEELYFDYKKIIKASVSSAVPLTEEEAGKLKKKLEELFDQTVVIENRVDPSLIGGLYIRAKDRIIDASVKGRLEQLKDNLIYDNKQR